MTEGLDEKEGLEEEEEKEDFTEGVEEEDDEGFAEGIPDDEEKDDEEKPKKKKSTDEEADTFTANIEKMQSLLNQTETLVNQSNQQGFHTMSSSYAEYK
jgi:hypothetical protein